MADSLGSIIKRRISDLGYESKMAEWTAVHIWDEIVGEKLRSVSKAERISGHILYVSVRDSAWSHHLTLMKRDFLSKINSTLGSDVVKDIRFRVGMRQRAADGAETTERSLPAGEFARELQSIHLDDDELRVVKDVSSVIHDSTLRDVFERLHIIDIKRKKWRSRHQ